MERDYAVSEKKVSSQLNWNVNLKSNLQVLVKCPFTYWKCLINSSLD